MKLVGLEGGMIRGDDLGGGGVLTIPSPMHWMKPCI